VWVGWRYVPGQLEWCLDVIAHEIENVRTFFTELFSWGFGTFVLRVWVFDRLGLNEWLLIFQLQCVWSQGGPLYTSGLYMYRQFNIQQLYVLHTFLVCALFGSAKTGGFFPIKTKRTGSYNRHTLWLLRRTRLSSNVRRFGTLYLFHLHGQVDEGMVCITATHCDSCALRTGSLAVIWCQFTVWSFAMPQAVTCRPFGVSVDVWLTVLTACQCDNSLC
jgi:hypothetical protein